MSGGAARWWRGGRGLVLRVRLLQGCVALTLAAPVVAGLGGHGAAMLAALWAAFVAARVALAPWLLPLAAAAVPPFLGQVLLQGALVALLLGLGLGLGASTGWSPAVPALLPPAMPLAAAALGRALWRPLPPDPRLEAFLDSALPRLSASAQAARRPLPAEDGARVAQVMDALETLPGDTPFAALESRLAWVGWGPAGRLLEQALLDRVAAGGAPRPVAAALAIAASDGLRIEDAGGDYPARAFSLLPDDAGILAVFARRCADALVADPALWGALPTPALLAGRAERLRGTPAADELDRLAALCRRPDAEDSP